jgi:hypothetical protein
LFAAAFLPEQISEATAIAVTGGVNPAFVHAVVFPDGCKHGVEEFEIPVLLISG